MNAAAVTRGRWLALLTWAVLIASASLFAARLPGVLQGGADAIPNSESDVVTRRR